MATAPGNYIKSLDGVRGIAVLLVVMIHSHLCPFGWVGVQVFFVLSGFLITRILLAGRGQQLKPFLLRFYWRRGLRIWPVYFGFLLISFGTYLVWGIPETFRNAWLWLVTFSYNFARIDPNFTDSNYFGHFWTLCIEEQFYLVWPFVVYLVSREWLKRIVVGLIVMGPLLRLGSGLLLSLVYENPAEIAAGVHNLPTSHLDAFATGGGLALLNAEPAAQQSKIHRWLRQNCLSVLGGSLIFTVAAGMAQAAWQHHAGIQPNWLALGYAALGHHYQYTWAYSLLNLCSAGAILCALYSPLVSKVLCWDGFHLSGEFPTGSMCFIFRSCTFLISYGPPRITPRLG